MFFEDYTKTGVVYHIATINDLKKIIEEGIQYDDKVTYRTKYCDFHQFLDHHRHEGIPTWVNRSRAIFASMNYRNAPLFHSHSVVLAIRIDEEKCWVANENRANQLYEPFVLKEIPQFDSANAYINNVGIELIRDYWGSSLSFKDNLQKRYDQKEGYDAEVLVLHSIPPEDIEILYIISDHRVLTLQEWMGVFLKEDI
ncbi:DarT ssDNA thymidine ADP-ribosyltransferase family protein [Alkaliphilus hydrothermalis]|uniref:DarT domain-containing protein n=1 Tax=Alkaliphilus hydrothermalis TaxID=1482730 RepID=A0ABS2NQJ6_9FIRM|nr:DarT ssDNA thymidine ADP-ribosyltransferase family protein [Alkaliphilus hydrothermalis]MBM7615162.1 hypothetical protein [Alkaliphilus hydrothermalis]